MWTNILIGILLILFTCLIHTLITRIIKNIVKRLSQHQFHFQQILHIFMVVIIILLATVSESIAWASVYLRIGAIEALEKAIYFSLVTYTTLGYGDIILSEEYRLLGGIEAVNGVIMLGWSTAIVVAVIQRVFGTGKR